VSVDAHALPAVSAVTVRPGASLWKRFSRNRVGVFGLIVLSLLILAAVLAPVIAPYGPSESIPAPSGRIERLQNPSWRHWLGTDHLGRDVWSRVLYGAQVSLSVGLAATLITVGVGVLIGSLAGYFGGRVDMVLMRVTDVVLSFPILVLLIALAAVMRPTLWGVMVTIGLVFWTRTARIVRGEFLRLRESLFVQAAVAGGAAPRRIITRHILVNAFSPIVVDATLRVAYAILLEATLSFLGIGLQEPTPSWGRMLNAASSLSVLEGKPWLWLAPGMAIILTTLSINFVGDGLRDALDPKLRGA
jgi:peptide/nickel transport system permease protein